MEARVRKEDMSATGRALMKTDSSYPCPDKQESPITAAAMPLLSITAGWQVLRWHEKRAAHAASAGASPY